MGMKRKGGELGLTLFVLVYCRFGSCSNKDAIKVRNLLRKK